jgi:hypothetical protein
MTDPIEAGMLPLVPDLELIEIEIGIVRQSKGRDAQKADWKPSEQLPRIRAVKLHTGVVTRCNPLPSRRALWADFCRLLLIRRVVGVVEGLGWRGGRIPVVNPEQVLKHILGLQRGS